MTTIERGQTYNATVQWRQYPPDGPFVDVNNLQLEIKSLLDSSTIHGPSALGIVHPSVGNYGYTWAVSPAAVPADYALLWTATDPNTGGAISTFEVVTVVAASTSSGDTGPCDVWDAIWCDVPTEAVAVTGTNLRIASDILWALSGRQFGLCEVTLRPCRRDCFGGFWPYDTWSQWTGANWPRPVLFDGVWFNVACGSCPGSCSCTELEEMRLPGQVFDIVEVKVDGAVLPASSYLFYDNRTLVRVDGQRWPVCNDLNKADTQVGTWSVKARFGTPVPELGKKAVGELAKQLALFCVGGPCQLPQPIQSVSRQGVDITYIDPNELIDAKRTGLYLPDLFISTYNPQGLQARAQVFDIDGPHARRPS